MKTIRKILIIRFSSIGDIVLTTPVIRCLKTQLPGTEIHYLTKSPYLPLLAANPFINKIWTYDRNFGELIPLLRAEKFGFIVDLHKNFRSAFVRIRLGIRSAAFPKLNIRKWLAVRFKMDVLPDLHIVDRYFIAARPLGVVNDGKGLDCFIPARDEIEISALPETHRDGYLAIVTGGKHNTKIFPPDKVAEVCTRLVLPVVLLGGSEDRERGAQIAAMGGSLVHNACGRYSISQSASVIRQSRAVMTNDTGLMHIAAAFGKPLVSVWGNTIPAFGMYPYMPGAPSAQSLISEVNGLRCRPCSKLGYSECPEKHFRCMKDIEIGPIVGFLNRHF